MKEFSVVLNDKNPVMINTMLNKLFVPQLPVPARYLHALMVKKYDMVSALKTEDQTTQFMANLQYVGGRAMFTQSLTLLEEGNGDHWSIFISQTNKTRATDLIPPNTVEQSYGSAWAALSISNALVGTENFDVCIPGHERNVCLLLQSVVEALKMTHYFNVYVHQGKQLVLKCTSPTDPTVVMIKTRSWSELALLTHQTQNQSFEGRITTAIH